MKNSPICETTDALELPLILVILPFNISILTEVEFSESEIAASIGTLNGPSIFVAQLLKEPLKANNNRTKVNILPERRRSWRRHSHLERGLFSVH